MENNKKILIVVIFFLSVGWAVAGFLPKKGPATPNIKVTANKTEQVAPVVFSGQKELMDLIEADRGSLGGTVASSWGGRNPFDGVASKALLVPDVEVKDLFKDKKIVLSGILWSGQRPNAIINNKVVGIGGDVEGLKIKEIKEGMVVLSDGVNEMVLSLRKK